MATIDLPNGTIDYSDQGTGPVLVLIHGFVMGGSVFREVVDDLARDHRVLVPELPFGGHRLAMPRHADMSAPAMAKMILDFLEALDLTDVTLVGNDWAAVQFVMSLGPAPRIAKLVIAATEAFENYPPGRGGKALMVVARNRLTLSAFLAPFRIPAFRRRGLMYDELARKRIPGDLIDQWLTPLLGDERIRRDFIRLVNATDLDAMKNVTAALGDITQPTLVLWTDDDIMIPASHGPRLAEAIPNAQLVVVSDSGTLIPLDQPELFTAEVRKFVAG